MPPADSCCYTTALLGALVLFTAGFAPAGGAAEPAEWEPQVAPALSFDGELDLKSSWLDNGALGERSPDRRRLSEQELQLGVSYGGARFAAFGALQFTAEQLRFADATPRTSETAVERGEMWVWFKRALDSALAVQAGRLDFAEPRRWWWDEERDALRVSYAGRRWRGFIAAAEELARTTSDQRFIAPEDEGVRRLIGQVDWPLSDAVNLSGFVLAQHDASDAAPGALLESAREDDSDADLTWAGLRASGELAVAQRHRLPYRADAAVVAGDETAVTYAEDAPGISRVLAAERRLVRGWAVDLAVTWTPPLPGAPRVTLSHAVGSGDGNPDDDTDRAFRQTGLQSSDETFRDYGVVLRPELANLRVTSLALEWPLPAEARLALGYHRFRQVHPAPFVSGTLLAIEPEGSGTALGSEINVAVQWSHGGDLRVELIAGSFKAGSAYGARAGARAKRLFLSLLYEF